ncbi:MAG: bifunctional 2',3'-cyclic-nucleotide 2'-phosphodiesterase/3'-nucleotidase [Rudaea sp.]
MKLRPALLAVTLALAACSSVPLRPADGTHAEIGVLETTDLHSNVMSYDYYKLAPDASLGLERAATLILSARKEFPNTLLFDDGDTIQGTALADYQALVAKPACNQELAIYKAMDTLGYDASTIGNHEFNYGLQFLSRVTGTPFDVTGIKAETCKGPDFPFVLSNVFRTKTGQPLYAPWRILTRHIQARAPDGSEREAIIRIGVIGFTTPPIMQWDKRNLEGKVTVLGVVEAARKYVPQVRKAGADIVVAIVHGGINTAPYTPNMENADWYLAKVPGIDVMLTGHSHQIFPDPHNPKSHYAHMRGVDNVRGYVNGVPAVMGDFFGKAIGVIDLHLRYADGHWQVDKDTTHSEVRLVAPRGGTPVKPDMQIARLVAAEHAATIAYVKTPIGRSDFPMSTYFVAAGDTSALTVVNAAQRDYVEKYIKSNMPKFAGIPVLAAAAPFKAGFGGPNDYTDVPAGPLAINNAADLYLYPNTLTAVKTDGAGVKAWLEKSAQWFNRIDPSKTTPQELVSRRFPTYNFDVIQGNAAHGGLTYDIDVTRAQGQRIEDLRFDGAPVRDDQAFIVVTNNYRASGGGGFPGLDGHNIVLSAPDANRDVLIDYIRAAGELTRARYGNLRNWHFAKVKTAGPVLFTSAAGKLDLASSDGLHNVTLWKDNGDGTAVYAVDLAQ